MEKTTRRAARIPPRPLAEVNCADLDGSDRGNCGADIVPSSNSSGRGKGKGIARSSILDE